MRNLKKVLTLVLAIVMVVGCLAIGAGAAYTDDAAISYDDAVSTLTSLGVFEGSDGAFNPKANLTRQEVAKIVTVLLTGGNFDPALYEDAKIFTDVDGLWGEGYINYLAGAGIATGHAGKYNPQDPVTAQELAKFMLVALGYPAELFTGDNWAANINRVATTAKYDNAAGNLYKDYIGTYNKALTREEAALIMYNALTADMVQAQWNSSIYSDGSWQWSWTSIDTDPSGSVDYLSLVEKYFNCTGNESGKVVATAADYVELTGNEVVVSYDDSGTKYAVANYDGKLNDSVTVYIHNKTEAVVAVGSITPDPAPKAVTLTTTTAMTEAAANAALLAAGWTKTAADAVDGTVASVSKQGVKVVYYQNAAGDGLDTTKGSGAGYVITKVAMPYYVTDNTTYFTVTAIGTDTTYTTAGEDYYDVQKVASKNTGVFYNYDSLVKGGYYTVTDLADNAGADTAVRVKYATATPVVTFTPMATVAGVVGESFTANTVTLSGKAYALSFLNDNLSDPEPGYANKSTQNVYLAGLSKSDNGATVVGANLVLDSFGNIVAATPAGTTVTSSDYIYVFAANVTLNGVGTAFSSISAQIEAMTDDGAYGIYNLALTYKAGDGFYTGNTKVCGVTDDDTVVEAALAGWWTYTMADGVVTLVTDAAEATVTTEYTVTSGTVNPSVIYIGGEAKIVTDATEFIYFNDPGDNHKSTMVSVTKAAAKTIETGAVYVQYTDTTNTVVAKIIDIQATYGAGTDTKYVYVDKASESATYDGTTYTYTYTYATINEAGVPGSASVKGTAVLASGVYALMTDGTISTTLAPVTSYVSTTGNVVQLGAGYFAVAEGVAPVLTAANLKVEAGAVVYYTTNTAGYVTAMWVVAPAAAVTPETTPADVAAVKDLDDGVYKFDSNPGDLDVYPGTQAKDLMYFKYTTTETGTVTFKITKTTAGDMFSETFANDTAGDHFFYVQVTNSADSATEVRNAGTNGTNGTLAGVGTELTAGSYTYTITGGGVDISGSFSIA